MKGLLNIRKALPLLGALFLSACATSPATSYVESARANLSIDNVRYCSGYSCHNIHSIGLEAYEWTAIEALFGGDILDPAEEREMWQIEASVQQQIKAGQILKISMDADLRNLEVREVSLRP